MGCISSKPSDIGSSTQQSSSSSPLQTNKAKSADEAKMELVFKAKRANVFTQGVDVQTVHTPKSIPKNQMQNQTISKIIWPAIFISVLCIYHD